jgi:hypothetical protein
MDLTGLKDLLKKEGLYLGTLMFSGQNAFSRNFRGLEIQSDDGARLAQRGCRVTFGKDRKV